MTCARSSGILTRKLACMVRQHESQRRACERDGRSAAALGKVFCVKFPTTVVSSPLIGRNYQRIDGRLTLPIVDGFRVCARRR